MNRRQILKYAAMVTGTAICAPLTTAMLSGCTDQTSIPPTAGSASAAQFFSADEFKLLTQLIDVILPKTDTPAASEVGVHLIIDNMFAKVYDPEYQSKFTTLLAELNQHLQDKDFFSASKQQQVILLKALETVSEDQRNNAYWSYIDIKQQTVVFYLSTEEIAENHLNYLPIPGEYKPCVSLEELGGKAWAI
ncbi:gluconate 2-dehydrogenase subunit 3 family protein [Alteromonadaceae bacterium BrNp21-10]|nr:gluconate 2-dehydrogenase subunit 3 family protein [Alteromonadaceae bacterium BrNp21-10]